MAFVLRNLSVLAYAQGFTLWHYRAERDALATVDRPGFFDAAADLLQGGDMMLISARDGGRARFVNRNEKAIETVPL